MSTKQGISFHWCKRTDMAAKCKIFMNCNESFLDICKTQIWLPNKEYLRDHKCEGKIWLTHVKS